MENEIKKTKVTSVVLLVLVSILPIIIYMLVPNSPFTCVFVSVYTVAAFATAYLSTMKKGSIALNPLNLPAVGANIVCIAHGGYAQVCTDNDLDKLIGLAACGLLFCIGLVVNHFRKNKDISKPYHKLLLLFFCLLTVSSCVSFINIAFDNSEPITVKTQVVQHRAYSVSYELVVTSDEKAYNADLSVQTLNVNKKAHEYYEDGDTVSVSVKKGALGISYCRFIPEDYTGESVWEKYSGPFGRFGHD
ncbi:MAG: hypothetical protein ACI4XE_11680 [Acutalibacteraceae bacterium]